MRFRMIVVCRRGLCSESLLLLLEEIETVMDATQTKGVATVWQ
jgi:hypothetical protein